MADKKTETGHIYNNNQNYGTTLNRETTQKTHETFLLLSQPAENHYSFLHNSEFNDYLSLDNGKALNQ